MVEEPIKLTKLTKSTKLAKPTKFTKLQLACCSMDIGKIKKLIKDGGASLEKGHYSETGFFPPLHIAVLRAIYGGKRDGLKIIKLLIDSGANVNEQDPSYYGSRPLHMTVAREPNLEQRDSLEVAQVLIDHGAEVDGKDGDGRTVFRLAESVGYEDLKLLLIENGYDKVYLSSESVK